MPMGRRVENHRPVNVALPGCGLKLIDYSPKRLEKAAKREELRRYERKAALMELKSGLICCGIVIAICLVIAFLYIFVINKRR